MTEVARLLRAVRDGSRDALDRLVHCQVDRLYTIARRVTGDPAAAEDVVQETFLRILERRATLRKDEAAEAWLARIATCIAIDQVRGREARRRREERHSMAQEHGNRSAEDEVLDAERAEEVTEALSSLPLETRAAVWLHVVEDVGIREVAACLGASRASAHRRIQGGLEDLRRRLRGRGFPVSAAAPLADLLRRLPLDPAPAALLGRMEALGAGLGATGGAGSATSSSGAASTGASPASGPFTAVKIGGALMSGKKLGVSVVLSLVLLGGLMLLVDPYGWRARRFQEVQVAAGVGGKSTPALESKALVTPRPEDGGVPDAQAAATIAFAPASVSGRILNSAGNGVSGARVLALSGKLWGSLMDEKPLDAFLGPPDAGARMRKLREDYDRIGEKLPRVLSSEDGVYALRHLEDGEYRIIVRHEGYMPEGGSFVLVSAGSAVRCDVELVEAFAITGRVLDGDGTPVAEAVVRAEPSESAVLTGPAGKMKALMDLTEGSVLLDSEPVRSDPEGSFKISSLPSAPYHLTARKDGYVEGTAAGVLPGIGDVVLILKLGSTVEGRVVDSRRSPVAGASISLRPAAWADAEQAEAPEFFGSEDLDEDTKSVATGSDGRFHIRGLEEGPYELRVSIEGIRRLRTEIGVSGRRVVLGDVALDPGRTIEGTVLGPDSMPLAGARVWVPEPPRNPIRSLDARFAEWHASFAASLAEALTDAGGGFRLEGLPEGKFEVAASRDGFGGTLASDVEAGSRGIEIVLAPNLVLAGRVVDAKGGLPVEGARVSLGITREVNATSDARGAFELSGVSFNPGVRTVDLRVIHPDYNPWEECRGIDEARAKAPLEIRLSRLRRMEGRVVDSKGAAVRDARVSVHVPGVPGGIHGFLPGGWPADALSAEDGSFSVQVPEKVIDRRVTAVEVVAAHPAFAASRVGPIPSAAGGSALPEIEIVLTQGASLEGTIVDHGGRPVAGALVLARRSIPLEAPMEEASFFPGLLPFHGAQVGYSGKDGSYKVRRLGPGEYDVEVVVQGRSRKKLEGLQVREGPARQDIVIESGGSISGRVVDSSGAPIAGAEVVVFLDAEEAEEPGRESEERRRARENRRWTRMTQGQGMGSTRTGEDGRFALEEIPVGVFHLVARARGYEGADATSVRPGEIPEDLVMVRLSSLGGVVSAADTGRRVSGFRVHPFRKKEEGDRARAEYQAWTETGYFLRTLESNDAEGRFLYEGILPGIYKVTVEAEGYAPWHGKATLAAGEEKSLDVVLERGSRIEGIVLDAESGKPIPGALIDYPRKGAQFQVSRSDRIKSGTDGRFRIEGLEEGRHHLIADHPDYFYDQGLGKCVQVEVPGDEASTVELKMQPAGKLAGRIEGIRVKEEGQYRSYLCLTEIGEGEGRPGKPAAPAPSGDAERPREHWAWIRDASDGAYVRDRLPPGKFRVDLRNAGHEKIADLGEVEIRAGETTRLDGKVGG